MKKLILCFLLHCFLYQDISLAFWGIYDPIRSPKIGECFPSDPFTKKYILTEENLFYRRKVFTCEYHCINSDYSSEMIVGTSDKKDWLKEDGRSFVCEGFAENMVFVETPNNPRSWGYWSLRGSTPFYPMHRSIPELKEWFLNSIKNPSLDMLFSPSSPFPICSTQDC
ncbi:MAG: hypothetical protein VX642_14555 [Bdellovibrionota bacterium]|nr:hypothetical protein [Bdellovibrionota bacterium]